MHRTQIRLRTAIIAAMLMLLGGIAAVLPVAPAAVPTDNWVRTVDGWERAAWRMDMHEPEPGLHPIVPALGIALLSVLWLVAFPHAEQQRRDKPAFVPVIRRPHAWGRSRAESPRQRSI